MRRLLLAAVLAALASPTVRAADLLEQQAVIGDCIMAAAHVHRVPPAILVILLNVEGGSLGRVSANTNRTVDIGPMQVNQIWLPAIAAHWHAAIPETYAALRDNFCANVEAGAWILRQGLDEAHGDFWEGVGYYHSHDPDYKRIYLRAVLRQALRLRALSDHTERGTGTSDRPAAIVTDQRHGSGW